MYDLVEKEEFNFALASIGAKRKCKRCYGRGYNINQVGTISPNRPHVNTNTIYKKSPEKILYVKCPCVNVELGKFS